MLGRNLYKKYQGKCVEAESRIERDVSRYGANSRDSCLIGIIRLFTSEEWREKDSEDLFLLTSDHEKFRSACGLIRERVLDLQADEMTSWAIIYVISVLCEDTWAIYDLIVHISRGDHLVPVLDMLYYLAALLLYLRRKHFIPSRLHYNLLHALNLHENTPNPTINANNSTYEQLQIIEHILQPEQKVKVIGFAGTGKTSILAQYAAANPNKHFLLVVFRKKRTPGVSFPQNVTIRTLHSLAFHAVGHIYSEANKMREFGVTDILKSQVLPEREPPTNKYRYLRAKLIDQTIKNFIGSADPFITTEHIPNNEDDAHRTLDETYEPRPSSAPSFVPEDIVEDAELLWRTMKSKADLRFPMSHDGYLKEWQLTGPQLQFDNILVDEAEDFSDAMIDIIRKQSCPRIVVGDPHQHIFSFRAEHSPFAAMEATHTYYLTRSFRFGPAIGFVGNSCLEALKGVKEQFLVGCEIRDSLVNNDEELIVANPPNQIAILARTRIELFKNIVQMFCNDQGLLRPEKSNFVIGTINPKKFEKTLQMIHDVWALDHDNQPFSYRPDFQFESFVALVEYCQTVNDKKLKGLVSFVQWANNRLPNCLETIQQILQPYSQIVYGTVYEAKNSYWDTVILLDDFPYTQIPHTPLTPVRGGSVELPNNKAHNILYTAATRATKRLVMNSAVFLVLAAVQERMERFVSASDYMERNPGARCSECNILLPNTGNTLLLEVIRVRVQNDPVTGGALCCHCATRPFYMRPSSLSPQKGRIPEKPRTDFGRQTYAAWVGPLSEEELALINEVNNVLKDYYLSLSQS